MDAATPPAIGAFDCVRRVGYGATATIWYGVHRPSGAEVAIKVLTHALWRGEQRGGHFEREVRALARLDHPAIIRIHDYGWLADGPVLESLALDGACPYLVMDWYPQGTLADMRADLPYAELRALLLRLLDGLAFAHARGFVHRDLKPGNVLMSPEGPVCTDMGLVWSQVDGALAEREISGTPAYMAPEQAAGRSEDFGPWTDLYALGCIAWARITGRPPHQRATIAETIRACRRGALPLLRPRIALPRDFERWLRAMLAPTPRARFRFAADAARALRALPATPATLPGVVPVEGARPAVVDGRTSTFDAAQATVTDDRASTLDAAQATASGATIVDGQTSTLDVSRATVSATRIRVDGLSSHDDAAATRPPPIVLDFDEDWRRTRRASPTPVSGGGRRLARLRVPEMSGRFAARDRLWRELRAVGLHGRTRVVCIDGGPGVGKTRLAEWLAHRSHELGYADALWIRPRQHPSSRSGLWTMLLPRAARRSTTVEALGRNLEAALDLDAGRCVRAAARTTRC